MKLERKTKPELSKTLNEKREKLRKLRFELSMDKLKRHIELRRTKKDIARILTMINSKNKK